MLFRNEVLGVEERSKRLLTLRYKYFVMGGMRGRDGREEILRISVIRRKIKPKLIFHRLPKNKPNPPNTWHTCMATKLLRTHYQE